MGIMRGIAEGDDAQSTIDGPATVDAMRPLVRGG